MSREQSRSTFPRPSHVYSIESSCPATEWLYRRIIGAFGSQAKPRFASFHVVLITGIARYAILIGINDYPQSPLKGCVRDVEVLQRRLRGLSGNIEIRKFTANLATSNISNNSTTDLDVWPSYRNIITCLQDVASSALAGDFVYIHYSGHGTMTEHQDTVSNDTTHELAIVLPEAPGSEEMRCLEGLTLAKHLQTMVGKGLIVTLVLDCCFSGGVVRKESEVRFLEYDPAWSLPPLLDVPPSSNRQTDDSSDDRAASMRPNWLINPEGYTILTACGPNEIAKELTLNRSGDKHGALSYFLLRTFDKLGGVKGKQQQVYHHLCARFTEYRAKGLIRQNPMFYGNAKLCFFGLDSMQQQSNPIAVVVKPNGNVQIEAGRAHGVSVLDEFTLRPLDIHTSGAACNQTSEIAQVTEVGALTSELTLSGGSMNPPETGWMANRLSAAALLDYPIMLLAQHSDIYTLASSLGGSRSLNITNDANSAQKFAMIITAHENDVFEIRDEESNRTMTLPGTGTSKEEDMQHVLDVATHICKYWMARHIYNPIGKESSYAFYQSFDARMVDKGGNVFYPGCRKVTYKYQQCSHESCTIQIDDGELQLQVENRNQSDGDALYLHLYNLSSDWEVTNMLRANHDVIPPKNFAHRASGIWRKRIKMVLTDEQKRSGLPYVDDVVKLFLTARPTSFAALELSELVSPLQIKSLDTDRGGAWDNGSEDWIALDFRIRTKIR